MKSRFWIAGVVLATALCVAIPLVASGGIIRDTGDAQGKAFLVESIGSASVLASSSTLPQANGWFRGSVDVTVSADTSVTVVKNGGSVLTTESVKEYPFVVSDPGTATITHWSVGAGPASADTATIRIDTMAPLTTSGQTAVLPGLNGWSRSPAALTLSATDALSGVAFTSYRVGAGTATAYSVPFTVPSEGITLVHFHSTDLAGNVEAEKEALVRIDTLAPTVTSNASSTSGVPSVVTITAADAVSGLDRVEYRLDSGTTQTVSGMGSIPVSVPAAGIHTLTYFAVDNAGNSSAATTESFSTGIPFTSISGLPVGWTNSNVVFSLSATSTGGTSSTVYYGQNAPVLQIYTAPVTISAEGTTTIYYRSVDASGNIEATKTATVRIDKTAPRQSALLSYTALTDSSVRLAWSMATDDVSGVSYYEVRDGASLVATTTGNAYTLTGLLAASTHTFSVVAVDQAGNRSEPTQIVVTLPSTAATQYVPAGANRVATLSLASGGTTQSVVVTFPNVTTGGTLSAVYAAGPPAVAPAGLRFVGIYFDVNFTGSFTGTATVTLPYPASIPDGRAANMTVLHWVNGAYWVNSPTTVDVINHTATVQLTSMGPLALAEPSTVNLLATITPRFIRFYPPYDNASSVTVYLRDAAGERLNGCSLVLQRLEGATWTTYSTMATTGDGTYRGWVKPINYRKTSIRALLSDSVFGYTAVSRTLTLIPEVWLSAPKPSVSSIRRYHRFSVSGSMLPAHSGTGTFYVTKWNGHHYDTISKYTKSIKFSSSGTFKTYISLPKGTYRFYSGEGRDHYTADHGKSRSGRSSKVTVR